MHSAGSLDGSKARPETKLAKTQVGLGVTRRIGPTKHDRSVVVFKKPESKPSRRRRF